MDRKVMLKIVAFGVICLCLLSVWLDFGANWVLENVFMRTEVYSSMSELAYNFIQTGDIPTIELFNQTTLNNGNIQIEMKDRSFETLTMTFNGYNQLVNYEPSITFFGNCLFTAISVMVALGIVAVMFLFTLRQLQSTTTYPEEDGE